MSQANTSPVVVHGILPEALPSPPQQAAEESPDEIPNEDLFDYLPVPPTIIGHITARFHEVGKLPPMPFPSDESDEQDE